MNLELVNKARKGCSNSFGIVVFKVREQAYKVAFCYLKNSEDSMDAVCNAVEKAWVGIGKLKQPEFFRTWFIRIVINECKKRLTHQAKIVLFDDYKDLSSKSAESYELPPETDIKIDLKELLDSLKPEDRTMLYMKYYMDYSLEDISKAVKMPLNTVKTRIYTALKKLRRQVQEGELV